MTSVFYSVTIPKPPEERARDYLDRVARKRQRDADRAMRRWQRFADGLWNMALGGALILFTFAVLVSL